MSELPNTKIWWRNLWDKDSIVPKLWWDL